MTWTNKHKQVSNSVNVYITGHEHNFQSHVSHCGRLLNLVAGAACDSRLYGAADEQQDIDWVDQGGNIGFLSAEVWMDRIEFKFIGVTQQQPQDSLSVHEPPVLKVLKEISLARLSTL